MPDVNTKSECCALCIFHFLQWTCVILEKVKIGSHWENKVCPAIYQAGVTDSRASYQVSRRQHFSLVHAATVKCQYDPHFLSVLDHWEFLFSKFRLSETWSCISKEGRTLALTRGPGQFYTQKHLWFIIGMQAGARGFLHMGHISFSLKFMVPEESDPDRSPPKAAHIVKPVSLSSDASFRFYRTSSSRHSPSTVLCCR